MQKTVKILGVRFDNVTMEQAVKKALAFAGHNQKRYICTPNPEMLLEAQKNRKFLRILNDSNLNVPDGFGIILASKYKKKPLKERVTGTDLMREILLKTDKKIFLLGAKESIAEETAKKFPNARITGTFAGSPSPQDESKIRKLIDKSEAEILFVAYGAPAQELWIARNMNHLCTVRLSVGVGGAFDFLAGKVKRAPKLMRETGLEWLYRLIKEPRRIRRIYNAVVRFPLKVIFS